MKDAIFVDETDPKMMAWFESVKNKCEWRYLDVVLDKNDKKVGVVLVPIGKSKTIKEIVKQANSFHPNGKETIVYY